MRTKSLVPAVAIAITMVAGSTKTHADPSLPEGWIAGGPAAPMTAEASPSPRSREALQLASSPLRPVIAPVPLALDAFDVVDVEPALTDKELESNADASGEPATDFFVDRGCHRASVSGHAVGDVQVGWVSLPIGPQSSGGVDLYHVRGSNGGDGVHRYAHAIWETLDRQPDGTLRYTHTDGRFNLRTCKTRVASRYTVTARPLFGGLAYLFRTRCAKCEPAQREVLHVLTPPSGWGNEEYGHRRVLLGGQHADSERVRVNDVRLRKFEKAFGRALPRVADGREILLGIETAQGLGEAAPSVIAYATEVRHVGF
ncbi:MAG: hypothetical protein QM820_13290 [Minicystis sp.]